MAVHTDTHSTMSCHSTIIPLSTQSMKFGRQPTCSRSALTTTDSSSLVAQFPRLPNDIIKPTSSKSCQTNYNRQILTSNYSRRQSQPKKRNDKNDTFQQQRNYVTDASPKKGGNHRRQLSSINTNDSSDFVTTSSNGNRPYHQQQPCSTGNVVSSSPRQHASGVARRSSLLKTPRPPSSYVHTTSGSDDESNCARNKSKNGSILNSTVSSTESETVPASAQKQKQKQQQRRLSHGGTSSSASQLTLPQQRRLSSTLSSAGYVKQNKTETFTPPPSLTKLQNARKTPLGTHPAGTVTSDSGSDGDDAAATMDNQQQIHMKQQQQHRVQHSQPQLQTFRRTNHQRHQPLQHQNDSLLHHQRRTSIASLSPLPHPNGVSSSSSSTLLRRRSFADLSPRSSLTPSASSTLSQHHHHHHQQQQQQQQQQSDQENKLHQQVLRNSQSHLRHPSWLDSAGFMRPSKCSICHPPPQKKSVITPPVGTGVPKFGLPPSDTPAASGAICGGGTTPTTSTPKQGLERRSSLRNSLVSEKLGRHMNSFGTSSSSIASAENGKNKSTISYIDGVARMDQRRRLSLPNPGNTTMDYSRAATTKKLGVEKRTSFYNKIVVSSTADHSTRRFSNKRIVAPRTKTGTQLSADTPILDKDFTHSPSSSSSLTEANTDTNSSSSSNPSPTTGDESRPSSPIDMKHQMTQLMESDYLKRIDGVNNNGYPEAHDILNESGLLKLQPSSPLSVAANDDVVQCGSNNDMDAFEQLQTFLDLSSTPAASTYTKENDQQTDFEIPPAHCTSSSSSSTSASSSLLSEMPLHLQDSSNDTKTKITVHHPTQSPPSTHLESPPSSSVLSELEQWTAMVKLTLGRWFTDFNHGHLEHYEKDADGSITTMTITGYVVSMEADLVNSFSLSLNEKIHQHRYTLCLGPEERKHDFTAMSASSSSWTPDDQVDRCQFKNKSAQCECEFDWMNRRHHCRRCGDIFCKTHSSNRLPLFTKRYPNQIKWSRVCDSCCSDLVGGFLMKI